LPVINYFLVLHGQKSAAEQEAKDYQGNKRLKENKK
jgi:hypothetical protein